MSTPGYPPPGDPYGPPPGQQGQPYPPPPPPGAPYNPQQPPTSGAPYNPQQPPYGQPAAPGYDAPDNPQQPPTSGAPYNPQQPPTSGVPYNPQQPPTSGVPYNPQQTAAPGFGAPAAPGYDAYQQGGYSGYTSGFPAAAPGGYPGAPAPPRQRRGLMIGLIVAIALVVLIGGGTTAILLLRGPGGDGQPNPTAAATNFLTAVYKDKDATKAAKYVCPSARDADQITSKVNEVKTYVQKFNRDPQFAWDEPKVESSGKERATLAVTVKFTTGDDRAAEQKLSIITVKDGGWFVCEVKTV